MGKLDRSVDINIGGETRHLKFTIARIEEVEAKTGKSALTIALDPPSDLKITELIDLVHIGLRHENSSLARETVASWVEDFLSANPIYTLNILVVGALGFSGLAGEVSAFETMMKRLTKKSEKSGKSDEGK